MANSFYSTQKILELLGVPHTSGYLKETILSHPDHHSLLSIADTLKKYKTDLVTVKIGKEKLDQLPLPCIVQVTDSGISLFYTLTKVSDVEVVFFNESNRKTSTGREEFINQWTGVSLMVERDSDSIEPGYKERIWEKRRFQIMTIIFFISLLTWIGLAYIPEMTLADVKWATINPILFLFLKLTGLIVSTMVLWYEVDRHNPALQRFCTGGKKVDCEAVLESNPLKALGKEISLSTLSFAYFFAGFFSLLISSFSVSAISLLGYLSLLALPVIAFSFYFQAKVIKKWCRFCLMIQGILVLEGLCVWLGGNLSDVVDLKVLSIFSSLFVASVLTWATIKPLLTAKNELNFYKRNLSKIKNNKEIFEYFLSKSKRISNSAGGLGIQLRNKNPKYHVLKVCNPYCGPCAKAHPILENLFEGGNIDLQILFFPNADMEDPKTKVINHFLAIDNKGDSKATQKALDQWYSSPEKNHEAFAKRYPMNGELNKQKEKLLVMKEWCEKEGITHTPTIFINGYELPKEFSVEELKDILT
ncbi:vitamin K epoxide reductase family protein [Belliella marina]|uniref:Vitamin K epoxide reductase family protein n=1 Tax=Belliella marina TaxID=1644146 RepID=A0ABW4VTR9_9BACT